MTSVNESVAYAAAAGQCQRHLYHSDRTGRPKHGRSMGRIRLLPLDRTGPPHPEHRTPRLCPDLNLQQFSGLVYSEHIGIA